MSRILRFAVHLAVLVAPGLASIAGAQPQLGTVRVASGLQRPVFVTAPPGDPRLFIVEQRGVIKILEEGQVLPVPFLDLDSLVVDLGDWPEVGMWGLAFDPDFPDSAFIYTCYCSNDNKTTVARYRISAANPDQVDYASVEIILALPHPHFAHYGGHIAFGRDRYFYLGTGDGGLAGDPFNRAQNGQDLNGKILRVDVRHGLPYTIPPDNPFVGNPSFRPEIWAYGLRNPYRWSFDRETGDLWLGDVGQDSLEEIDFTPATGLTHRTRGGENYGWRLMEGSSCYNPKQNCGQDTLKLPLWEYDHHVGCAVIGGYAYRGQSIPSLRGTYFCGEYCLGYIWSIERGESTVVTNRTVELRPGGGLAIDQCTGFGEDGFGELYIVDYGRGINGEVYKIVDRTLLDSGERAPPEGLRLSGFSPNPFSAATAITVTLDRPGRLEVALFDIAGREVARLASGNRPAGVYRLQWNATDRAGHRVPAGSYFLRASLDERVAARRVVHLR